MDQPMSEADAVVVLTVALERRDRQLRLAIILGLVTLLILLATCTGAVVLEFHNRAVYRSPCAKLNTAACAHKLAPDLRRELHGGDRTRP
jgi:hypothetical protein